MTTIKQFLTRECNERVYVGTSDLLWPSDVDVTMRDCLLNQSEANGPRRNHVTFVTLVNLSAKTQDFLLYRQRETVDPTAFGSYDGSK